MWQHQRGDGSIEYTTGPEGAIPIPVSAAQFYATAPAFTADARLLPQTPTWRPAHGPVRHPAIGWAPAYPMSPVGWGGQHIVPQTARAPGFSRDRGRGRGRGGSYRPDFGRGRGRQGPRNLVVGGTETSIEDIVWHVSRLAAQEVCLPVVLPALHAMDSRTAASLFKELAKSNLYWRSCQVFDWLRRLHLGHELRYHCDVFTYTAMIALCVDQRQLDRALELSEEMRINGIERNVHTYSALMNVCIKCGQHQLALDVYAQMQRYGCMPNVVTYNTLIDVYGKTGQWAEARKVLDEMAMQGIEPVTRTYNTLMIACNTSGQWQEALQVFSKMVAAGHEPNTTTFNALISAYSKAGRLEKVLEAYQEMVRCGCERSVITYSSLISACERAGQWEMALQLFSDMHKDGCVPNVITYNSLITACGQGAQWERAREVFDQMQKQGCAPDVVTYTALIGAYERGGQWCLALQAFEIMVRQGCKPDIIVYNAILDVLWETGITWAQRKASLLFRKASAEGHFRLSIMSGADIVELTVHSLTSGLAMLALLCWLCDLRERLLEEGSLPNTIAVTLRRGKQKEHSGGSMVRDAMQKLLTHCNSPFQQVQESRLETSGVKMAEWLQEESTRKLLRLFMPGPISKELEFNEGHESTVEQRCGEAYTAIQHFESTHCLNVQAMGVLYVEVRGRVVGDGLKAAASLGLQSECVHDAVLLMDRAASTGMNLQEPELPLALSACFCISLQQSRGPDQMPSDTILESAFGVPVEQLADMEARIRSVLDGDTSSISALRCLKLYLERIGADPVQDHLKPEEGGPVDIFSLMYNALVDSEFLNYRPSVVAAAALYCGRLNQGFLPFWPSALATLTGYSNTHTPELLAAIGGAQRLLGVMQDGAPPSEEAGPSSSAT